MSEASQKQKDHADKVWGRARANAFAHRAASGRYACLANVLFLMQLVLGLMSLFLVIILYAVISGEAAVATGKTPLILTLGSVVYTMVGLGVSVMQNYLGFEQRTIGHNHNQHSFLYLAQRCREIDSPVMSSAKAEALIDDLERDFQILKVRGQEPSDRDFRLGHEILQGVAESQFGHLQTAQLANIDGDGHATKAADSAGTKAEGKHPAGEGGVFEVVKKNEVRWYERHTCALVLCLFVITTSGSIWFVYCKAATQYNLDKNGHVASAAQNHSATSSKDGSPDVLMSGNPATVQPLPSSAN